MEVLLLQWRDQSADLGLVEVYCYWYGFFVLLNMFLQVQGSNPLMEVVTLLHSSGGYSAGVWIGDGGGAQEMQ